VFVLGCARSGTTLLYHMLLSAGGFAVFRSETHAFNLLEPAYGDLRVRRNKERMLRAWFDTRMFSISGLDKDEIRAKVLAGCENGGDFLRIVMSEIAQKQGILRWAECTPDHLLYISRIKQTIPDALIIHIIRDGRDVALSLDKQKWIRPLPGDGKQHLMVAALYWEWIVNRGREEGRKLGQDYCEVHFEQLVADPRPVLDRVSTFIGQELDYDRIQQVAIGSVAEPNTSFGANEGAGFNPVARWKESLTVDQLRTMESLVGSTLRELGYSTGGEPLQESLHALRARYRRYFDFKLWVKTRTPVGRYFVSKDLSWL
jgi:sulfotransferase family protein